MKLFLLTILVSSTNAFTSVHRPSPSSTCLYAAGGPPQYDKLEGRLRSAEELAQGSVMLHIDTSTPVDYEPGHVLALEMPISKTKLRKLKNEKTIKDAKDNDGWMRGPYTVSRSTENSIDILIRVVGEKSERFANATEGTPVRFGGKFHVPILEGIDVPTTKRVCMISSGVGVGPEKALDDGSYPPIDLICSYRNKDEIVYKEQMIKLQMKHPNKFSWKAGITSKQGRVSANDENLKAITESKFDAGLEDTHYHLIGNGQLVSEFKAGLLKAGVPDDKVTVEMYFNHMAKADETVVDRIAAAVMKTAPVLA